MLSIYTYNIEFLLVLSSYAPEASGVACGLNWLRRDYSHVTYGVALLVGTAFLYVVAVFCVSSSKPERPVIVTRGQDYEWMNDRQLRWVR